MLGLLIEIRTVKLLQKFEFKNTFTTCETCLGEHFDVVKSSNLRVKFQRAFHFDFFLVVNGPNTFIAFVILICLVVSTLLAVIKIR